MRRLTAARKYRGGAAADPASITGLVRRWRADTIAQANGSAVSSWAAMTGGVALTQATGGNQPTYQTAVLGGQPAVRFATDDWLAATITAVAQPCSYVVIFDLTSVATYQTIIHNSVELQMTNVSTQWQMWCGSGNLDAGAANTNPVSLIGIAQTTSELFANNVSIGTGNVGTSGASTAFEVGRHPSVSRPLNGDIAEIMLYNKALSAGERTTIASYVLSRYGIS